MLTWTRSLGQYDRLIRHSRGFTLMEVLIVLVILAVIVGLAVPIYQTTVRKTYRGEALNILNGLRLSEARYYAQSGGTTFTPTIAELDFDPANTAGAVHFTYSVATAAGAFTATATGSASPVTGSTVTVTNTGTVGGTLV